MRSRRLAPALAVLAVLSFVWAMTPGFRDTEGWITTAAWLPYTVALALATLAIGVGTRFEIASRWIALAAVGQGAFLRLIEAGPTVSYQHLVVPWRLGEPAFLAAVTVVVLQIFALSTVGRETIGILHRGLVDRYSSARLMTVGGLFIITSATLSADVVQYGSELLFATGLQAVNLLTVLVGVRALPDTAMDWIRRQASHLLGPVGQSSHTPRVDRFTVVCALWVLGVAALLAVISYQRHPHVPDEFAYLIHARYFAAGMLDLPVPPVPAAFEVDLMTYEATRWYSPMPPGWPAILALGVLLGAPWLVNPVLGGVGVLLVSLLFQEVFERRTARVGLILLATSPWYVFMSMNFMTHTFTLVTALVAAVGVARSIRTGRLSYALLGGAGLGAVSLNRPLEGLIVAAFLGLWVLVDARERMALRLKRLCVLAGASALVGAVTLPYNHYFTGRATYFPVMAYMDRIFGVGSNAMGFGANRGSGWAGLDPLPGHGWLDVFVNGNLNLFAVNVELFGWSCGSLLLLILFLFGGRLRGADRMMIAAIAVTIGLHSFYWFGGGPDFGARYWYLILVPSVALGARGLIDLGTAWSIPERVLTAGAVLVVLTLAIFFPWRAVDKYHHYRGMRPDVRVLAAQEGFGDALVLVRGERHPDYVSAAVYNPLDLTGPGPIYAWDRNDAVRRLLLETYRDRPVWLIDGPTVTGQAFEVVEGPVSAEELLARLTGSGGPRGRDSIVTQSGGL